MIEDNITLGGPTITYEDVQWALQLVELDHDIDTLPNGLSTPITGHAGQFTLSQTLRLLLARAIVTRPSVLVIDGTFYSIMPAVHEIILRRLC